MYGNTEFMITIVCYFPSKSCFSFLNRQKMEPLHNLNADHPAGEASIHSNQPPADAISKSEHQRLFQRGLKWLVVGGILSVTSVGLNFLLFHSGTSFTTIMYIMTSVGAVCVMKGLVDILGFWVGGYWKIIGLLFPACKNPFALSQNTRNTFAPWGTVDNPNWYRIV